MMPPDTRVYVAGHRGLAGGAIRRALIERGYRNVVVRSHAELDLEDLPATRRFFEAQRPELVFLAAAKVGGIVANDTLPVDFLLRNLRIQSNVIESAHACGARRLIFLASNCAYPRDCAQPMREDALLTGPLEATNRPYALAKISGIECCWAFNRQYAARFLAVMPAGLYGPGDSYDPRNSHVLPALIRKMHEAKTEGRDEVPIWGSGAPRREFLHVDDMARAVVFLAELDAARFDELTDPRRCPIINVASGEELTVRELVDLVAAAVGYQGRFVYDPAKPDGTPRKALDGTRLRALGWRPAIALAQGLAQAYRDFLARHG